MHAAVREFQGPTGVTHALRGRFGPPGTPAWGVVFVKRSSVELYNVRANDAHARLDLLAVATLPTAVFSAAALRRPSVPQDFLLMGFSAMRVAALAWDPAVRDWHTLQAIDLAAVMNRLAAAVKNSTRDSQRPMSSVPGDEHRVLIRGRYSNSPSADVRVDDKGRCAAVLAQSLGVLMVLPMRSDADLTAAAANPTSVADPEPLVHEADIFSVDLREEYGVSNVKDFVFLDDCFEPTVLLLHEPKRTWAGRVSVLRNTAELVAISVDLRKKGHAKAWEMRNLPSDAHKVVAVPGSAGGGVLVFATNVLLQVRHEACAAGLSLNSFGDFYAKEVEATYGAIVKSKTLMSLDASRCAFLGLQDSSTALLSLKGGELYFLTVAGKHRTGLSMVRAGSTVLASAIVPINDRFFILASRISDSLLIEFRRSAAEPVAGAPGGGEGVNLAEGANGGAEDNGAMKDVPDAGAGAGETAKKPGKRASKRRRRTAEEEAEYEMLYGAKPPAESDSDSDGGGVDGANPLELVDKDEGTRGVYDDDDELGMVFTSGGTDDGGAAGAAAVRSESWVLVVKDTLTSYGPSADVAVGKSTGDAKGALDFVVAGGYAKNGCLGVVQQSLRPRDITRFALDGFTQAWTVRDPRGSRREAAAREARNSARDAKNTGIRERNESAQAARDAWIAEQLDALKPEAAKRSAATAEGEEGSSNENAEMKHGAGPAACAADGEGKDVDADAEPPPKFGKSDDMERIPRRPVASTPAAVDAGAPPGDTGGMSKRGNGDLAAAAAGPTAEQLAEIEERARADFPLEAEEALEDMIADVADLHSYLLLSGNASTVAMKTGDDLEELGSGVVDFLTDVRTLAAGNVLGHAAIVQVHVRGVRLLKDARVATEHFLAGGSPAVAAAQVCDPFVLLLLANGSLVVLKVTADEVEVTEGAAAEGADQANEKGAVSYRNVQLSVDFVLEPSHAGSRISSAHIYVGSLAADAGRNVVGDAASGAAGDVLATSSGGGTDPADVDPAAAGSSDPAGGDPAGGDDDMDEEERMLYGDAGVDGDDKDMADAQQGPVATAGTSSGHRLDHGGDAPLDGAEAGGSMECPGAAVESGVFPLPPGGGDAPAPDRGGGRALLVTATKDGALEMRCMEGPAYHVVFRYAHFFLAPQLVVDDGCEPGQSQAGVDVADGGAPAQGKTIKAKKKDRITSLVMTHVTGTALVPGLCTPVLVAIQASGFPLVYRAFVAPKVSSRGREQSSVRLTRVATGGMTTGMLEVAAASSGSVPLVPFENVAGRGGVLVGGKRPFVVFAERGFPRAHPLRCPVPAGSPASGVCGVTSFAELHNVNCPRGFVYVMHDGVVGVSELPSPAAVNMDAPTPFRKVPLRCTPHKVAYHAGSSTYGVLASMPTLTTREERLARILQSLEKHDKRHYESTVAQAEAETGDERLVRIPPLYEELHELRVYRPDGWQLIKSFKLKKGEVGLSIANVSVDVYKQRPANSGVHIPSTNRLEDGSESLFAASIKMRPKNMLVVGTGFLNGEDATSRGRLLMFEVSRQEIFSEASGVYTAFQLQLIAEKELPAPVTAVAPMEGYVVAGVGPQLGVYKLVQDEIVHLSFAFGQLFCTSIASVKQYVVSADMYKSISFHFFRNRNTSVNFLGKDYSHNMSYATEYLIENGNLSMVMSDGEGNIHMLDYAHAMVPESRGGKRLLLNGGVKYGSRINKFERVRVQAAPAAAAESGSGSAGQHATMFVTLDGGLGAIVPVSEAQYQQLERLTDVMIGAQDVARHAGLDPKDARTFRPSAASTQVLSQRLIDTRLALEALLLSPVRARTVGTMAGMTLDELIALCTFLDAVLMRF